MIESILIVLLQYWLTEPLSKYDQYLVGIQDVLEVDVT